MFLSYVALLFRISCGPVEHRWIWNIVRFDPITSLADRWRDEAEREVRCWFLVRGLGRRFISTSLYLPPDQRKGVGSPEAA